MLRFTRNKLVSVAREDENTLLAYGILDDDMYSMRMKVTISLPDMEILSIKGDWNRWTTPECWRAIPHLQEAVGISIEPGFRQKIQKTVSRRACRHHANILLECCYAAKEAAMLIRGDNPEREKSEPVSVEPVRKDAKVESGPSRPTVRNEESRVEKRRVAGKISKSKASGGVIIDLHAHTSLASPCSSANVDALIEEAKSIGLDGLCLTDHNYVWDPGRVDELRQKHEFLVLRGNEITTDQGDMVVFGLEKEIKGIIKLNELREEVVTAGGFMIVAHPFRGFLIFDMGQFGLTPEKAMERSLFKSVDAVETMNSKVTESENNFAAKVAEGLGLPATGGSDAHEVFEVGIYATRFFDTIKDEKDLIGALKGGDYSPIRFRQEGPAEI